MPVVSRIVLADANIFFGGLRDVFLCLRFHDVIHLHWTREIEDEWVRNLARKRGVDPGKLMDGVAIQMRVVAPDWEVTGYEQHIGRFKGVRAGDQHVAAAALALARDEYSGERVALVTRNVKDFKQSAFAGTAIARYEPDDYLSRLMVGSPVEVASACDMARAALATPPWSQAEYLDNLGNAQNCGRFAKQLAAQWKRQQESPPDSVVLTV
jgi:hypothetical protein